MRRTPVALSVLAAVLGTVVAVTPADATIPPAPLSRIETNDGTTVVIGTDGKPYGTGNNTDLQISSTPGNRTTLTPIAGLPTSTRADAVWSDGTAVLVLGSDGVAYASGNNEKHQIRSGSTADVGSLVPIEWLAGVTPVSMAVANQAIVAVLPDGTLKAAGLNTNGRLVGPSGEFAPTLLDPLPDGEQAVQVTSRYQATAVRTASGKIYTRGSSTDGQLAGASGTASSAWTLDPLPSTFTAVSIDLDDDHLVILGSNGKVYGSGKNTNGDIGFGSSHDSIELTGELPGGVTATALATGTNHTVAIASDGRIYGIGNNAYAQLPDAPESVNTTSNFAWTPLASGLAHDIVGVAAGTRDTVLTTDDDIVYGSGDNGVLAAQVGQITNGPPGTTESTNVAMRLLAGQVITNTALPTISGTAQFTRTLVANPGTWSPSVKDFTYQWAVGGLDIAGATSKTYTPAAQRIGDRISVRVTARRGRFADGQATSAATVPLSPGPALVYSATSKPTISGTLKSGRTLSISKSSSSLKNGFTVSAFGDTFYATGLKYQWYRSGSKVSGRTGSTYKLGSSDKGRSIQVRIYGSLENYATGSYITKSVKIAK